MFYVLYIVFYHIIKINILLLFTDRDECLTLGGKCEGVCINTVGSYFCQCTLGYQPININETMVCEGINIKNMYA